ncbi:MAG: hypothetical protein R3C16_06595 [Hyphomonadaceae bacterium]
MLNQAQGLKCPTPEGAVLRLSELQLIGKEEDAEQRRDRKRDEAFARPGPLEAEGVAVDCTAARLASGRRSTSPWRPRTPGESACAHQRFCGSLR